MTTKTPKHLYMSYYILTYITPKEKEKMTNNKWDKKIEEFEEKYCFDTPQERKLALRDFATEIEEDEENKQ